jgi:hypothetical protein
VATKTELLVFITPEDRDRPPAVVTAKLLTAGGAPMPGQVITFTPPVDWARSAPAPH